MQKNLINNNKTHLQAKSQQIDSQNNQEEDTDNSSGPETNNYIQQQEEEQVQQQTEKEPNVYKTLNPESDSSWDDSESSVDPDNQQAVRKNLRYTRVLRLLSVAPIS